MHYHKNETYPFCRQEDPLIERATSLWVIALCLLCTFALYGCDAQSDAITFSLPSGCYVQDEITLEITGGQGREIAYTLDGSDPTANSPRYTEPITLHDRSAEPAIIFTPEHVEQMSFDGSTVVESPQFPKANIVRAAAISPNGERGPIITGTFFVGVDPVQRYANAPIISLVTDSANLLDHETGILVKGAVYDAWASTDDAKQVVANRRWSDFKANATQHGRNWERPAHIEVIADGTSAAAANCGLRLKGHFSRVFLQRSFNVYMRDEYGSTTFDHPLIPSALDEDGQVISSYTQFSLRNGGNDAHFLKFRDAFLQSLVSRHALGTQASTPAIVFLNGEFMSVYNLQERYTAEYFERHFGVDGDEVVEIKDGEVETGNDADIALYEELLAFADEDLSKPEAWKRFEQAVDIESMLDYYATEIYVGNTDWKIDGNFVLWRTRTADPANPYADGRWRFCLYDLDQAANLYNYPDKGYDMDTLEWALENHPVLSAAVRNPEFAQQLLERIDELAKTDFAPERVAEELDTWAAEWKPMVDDYQQRFGGYGVWDRDIARLKEYFAKRPEYIAAYAKQDLGLSESQGNGAESHTG